MIGRRLFLGVVAWAGIASLGACTSQPAFPPLVVKPVFNADKMEVHWHRVTPEQLAAIVQVDCPTCSSASRLYGIAVPDPARGRCDVYAPMPSVEGLEVEAFGHEVMHCFLGTWHVSTFDGSAPPPPFTDDELAELRGKIAKALGKP